MKLPYESLDEEINAISNALENERQLEREDYLSAKKRGLQRLKALTLDDQFYATGGVRRLSFFYSQELKGIPWLRLGAPVYLEAAEFSIVCQIYRIIDKTITLQYRGDAELPEDESFQLSPWYSESTYSIYFEAIKVILDKDQKRARTLLGWILGYKTDDKPNAIRNFSKLTNLERVTGVKDYLFIFGPPGTGKTTLLTKAIQHWKENKQTVLALAPTNFACDYLVESAIMMGMKPVRLGISSKIGEKIHPYLLDHLIEQAKEQKQIQGWRREWRDLIKKARSWKRNFGREEREERKQLFIEAKQLQKTIDTLETTIRNRILDEAELVVSTFVPAWNFFKTGRVFDYVVIDEITQAIEPAFYLASLLGKNIILAGDPKQLPPTLREPNSILGETIIEKGLARDNSERTLFLGEQYRMPQEILQFSNEVFYENKVITLKPVSLRNPVREALAFEKNLIWIDTAGSDSQEKYEENEDSCYNEWEVNLILRLLQNEIDFKGIAILSPYRKQIEYLNLRINQEFNNRVELPLIQTIDSFQGREAETIILSFVRTNDEGELGFLKDYKRLNVGLTRAKETLILIGDSVTLSNDKTYRHLLKTVQSIGEYRSIFEYLD